MIGIKSIASYVPLAGVDNYAQGARFDKNEDFILGKIGSAFLPRKDADQETSDLCVEAVNALFANNPDLKRESIDVLIVVTQNGELQSLLVDGRENKYDRLIFAAATPIFLPTLGT